MSEKQIQTPHVIVFGGGPPHAWPCVAGAAGTGLVAEFSAQGHGAIWVQRARALHYALHEQQHRVSIHLDADLEFSQTLIPKLAEACEETRGIVGTVVAKSAKGAGLTTSLPVGTKLNKRQLLPTDKAIGSPMAIHREAYQQVLGEVDGHSVHFIETSPIGKYATLFHPLVDGGIDHADDASFCLRARHAGVPTHIMIDPDVQVIHYGEHGFTVREALEHARAAAEASAK